MTDATLPFPSLEPRPRGSFWWGLPIAVGCLVLGHMLAFAIEIQGVADPWPIAAFVAPFAVWTAACVLRRRWWSLAGALFFPVALAATWIFLVSSWIDYGC